MTASPALDVPLRPVIEAAVAAPVAEARARDAGFDDLRAFVVLLVLLHHSVLAYAAMFPPQPAIFTILPAPIVDPRRWIGFDALAVFDDTFFMALMFLLSGLFVWPSLRRKGGAQYLRDRLLRLGAPFALAAAILAPLAYYPSYAATGADAGLPGYFSAWLSLGYWPAGPAWFLWLLLVFDALAAGLFLLRRRFARAARRGDANGAPARFVAMLLVVSALVYVPLALAFGADRWVIFGPFSLQASRPLFYAAYFLAGLWLGAAGVERGFLARGGALARRWPLWVAAGLAAYVLRLAVIRKLLLPFVLAHQPLPLAPRLVSDLTIVFCCATISFACIAIFRRFALAHRAVLDSLSANCYGMYLVHYPIVVWLQFALLGLALGPIVKGALAFVGAVALSWAIAAALRRAPLIARAL